ncbi:PAS domain S-box-containing protein [Halopseudomonas sabulinigri]|uniref:histidine kinase n=1 Tax=Halopseudomonas sabulinigri TaxID=472181 RepID=A0A1H1TTE2_9GAMM|nr:PAS domain-containing protein [Halopseudomonas sabulinigri]SDS63361.1 PAS domain S-box-containing protein [Halopseudomonas sabulinigri]
MAKAPHIKAGPLVYLIGGIALGLFFLFLASSAWQQREQQWQEQLASQAEITRRSIEQSQVALRNQALMTARSLAEDPDTRRLIRRIKALSQAGPQNQGEILRLRAQLRRDFSGVWSILQRAGAQVLEVHLASPAQPLVRMQQVPDPVLGLPANNRPLLLRAQTTAQEQSGLELDQQGLRQAAVVPVRALDDAASPVVASIAVGFYVLPKPFADSLEGDAEIALLVPPSAVVDQSLLPATANGRWLLGRYSNPDINRWLDAAELPTRVTAPSHQQVRVGEHAYLVTWLPLIPADSTASEYQGAGRIAAWHDISAAAATHRSEQARLLVNWLLACLATALLLSFLMLASRAAQRRQSARHQQAILAESQQRERSRQLLSIIAKAQSAYIQRDQIERGFGQLLEQILELTDSRFGLVAQVVHDADSATRLHPYALTLQDSPSAAAPPPADPAGAARVLADNLPLFEPLLQRGEVVMLPALDNTSGLSALLAMPIHNDQQLVGVLALGNRSAGYDRDMLAFLGPLLATLGQLIQALRHNAEKHQIQQRLERQRHALRALNEVAAASGINLQERLARTLQLGCEHLQLSLGLVSRIEGAVYTVEASYAAEAPPTPGTRFDFDQTYCSLTYQANDVVAIDSMGSSRFSGHPCYQHFALEAYIGIPLLVAGERWGTLNFSSSARRNPPFDEVDLEFMRLSARWISSLLEQAEIEQQREDLLQRFNKLTRHLPGMVYQYQLSADGQAWFPYSSTGINEIYGITPEQAANSGDLALERVHPDDLDSVIESITASALRLKTWRAEYRVRHPLKGELWVAGFASPELLENGSIVWHGFIADITARKRIQLALASEQQRLARVIDATGVATWEWDLASDAVLINERWAQMIGYQPEELQPVTAQTWIQRIHPEDHAHFDQQLAAHLGGETPFYSCRCRVQHRDGHWLWVQDRGQVVERDAEGRAVRMSGTHADISNEMQRQEEIRQARSFLDALIDAASEVAIMAADMDGNITLFNTGAEKLLGYSADEVIGKLSPAVFHLPSEIQRHSEVLSAEAGHPVEGSEVFFYRARQGGSETLPCTYVRKDGTHRLVNLTLTRIADRDGGLVGFLGMATDITDLIQTTRALQKSESRYRGMVSNLPGAVYRCQADQQWTMVYLSQEIERITGYPASDFINNQRRSYASVIHPDDFDSTLLASAGVSADDASFELTYRLLHAQGHIVQVREKGRAEYDAQGQLKWFDGFIWDVTEQVRVEQLKSQFVSTVSHELRTPLTAISGAIKLINGGALGEVPAAMQKLLGIAEQNTQSLNTLINDLLDMERLAAGKIQFDLQVQPLRPLLHKALELNSSYADQYQVSQRCTTLDDAWVRVDALRLGQVLSNLLSNAAKFSHSGGDIQLSSKVEGGQVCISVTDQGAGIPPAFHAQIFQKFSQVDSSSTRQRGGSGLGLAISKELVQQMGGSIGFESEPGVGSRFWCCLPLQSPPNDDAPDRRSDNPEVTP